jgi:hypothetical protein
MRIETRDKSFKVRVDVSSSELGKILAVILEPSFRRWRYVDIDNGVKFVTFESGGAGKIIVVVSPENVVFRDESLADTLERETGINWARNSVERPRKLAVGFSSLVVIECNSVVDGC